MSIDRKNGDKLWYQAEQAELKQKCECNSFIDKGKGYVMPNDFTKIRFHFVYAVKHNGRCKAHLVAGGHLTAVPHESNLFRSSLFKRNKSHYFLRKTK